MSSPTVNATQAIQNAQSALQRKDKLSARHWAEMAASLAPEREEPWLLLAAVANPQASVGYLKQALKINPDSSRAKAGMDWALKRIETVAQTATTARVKVSKPVEMAPQTAATVPIRVFRPVTAPQTPVSIPENAKKSSKSFLFILLPVLLIAILAFSIWNASPVLAVFSSRFNAANGGHAPSWAQVGLAKATLTETPTATFTPTAAFTETSITTATPADTLAPTFTATTEPSQTPSASLTPVASPTTGSITDSTMEATPTALPTDTGSPAQTARQAQQPAPSSYSGGKSIVVSISQQHLWAYQDNTLVYSFVASTGMGNSTRVGTFHVQDKIPNAYGATWNIWMPDWLGIYYAGSLENGIHALPILSNGATLWAGYLGTPISFGCVVLGSFEAQQLYNWAEIGTPVTIQR